ncbi:MAG: HU family DNA-binding protein [Hyphomonadaceae bacterium]|nr:HU family DNA-binding protein [Hyphomonadaceae bacterium]
MARKAMKKAAKKAPATKKAAVRKSAKKAAPAAPKPVRVTATPGKTVTASTLLQSVADHLGLKKSEAKAMTEGYLDVVKAYVLKGAKVKIGDVGMIMIRHRKARMGRNPQTGAPVKIKASKKLAFRQSAVMKAAVMGGR